MSRMNNTLLHNIRSAFWNETALCRWCEYIEGVFPAATCCKTPPLDPPLDADITATTLPHSLCSGPVRFTRSRYFLAAMLEEKGRH